MQYAKHSKPGYSITLNILHGVHHQGSTKNLRLQAQAEVQEDAAKAAAGDAIRDLN